MNFGEKKLPTNRQLIVRGEAECTVCHEAECTVCHEAGSACYFENIRLLLLMEFCIGNCTHLSTIRE